MPISQRGRGVVRRLAGLALSLTLAAVAAGCSQQASQSPEASASSRGDDGVRGGAAAGRDDGSGTAPASYAVAEPGPLRDSLLRTDLLVTAEDTLPEAVVRRVRALPGVEAAMPFSLGAASVNGRTLNVAAVDPGEFRRFTPAAAAQARFVWDRVAGGEAAVDSAVNKRLIGKGDMLTLGSEEDSPQVHVGAYAPLVQTLGAGWAQRPWVQVVVNDRRGEQLGVVPGNALLISTGLTTPSQVSGPLRKLLGNTATLQTLALEFDISATQTAVLTGQTVPQVVGTFTYTNGPDGTINPDPAWVKEYVRTEEVPILGRVTCNKAMLPQLRGALEEIVRLGLASKIYPDQYAGCYYPRYIGRDPANGLSLHSWGIAFDINVPGNLRGTVGEIDRGVVAVFKRWGFAWGGDWNYTDPMHFEMAEVRRVG